MSNCEMGKEVSQQPSRGTKNCDETPRKCFRQPSHWWFFGRCPFSPSPIEPKPMQNSSKCKGEGSACGKAICRLPMSHLLQPSPKVALREKEERKKRRCEIKAPQTFRHLKPSRQSVNPCPTRCCHKPKGYPNRRKRCPVKRLWRKEMETARTPLNSLKLHCNHAESEQDSPRCYEKGTPFRWCTAEPLNPF
jgi:hypothetical protein